MPKQESAVEKNSTTVVTRSRRRLGSIDRDISRSTTPTKNILDSTLEIGTPKINRRNSQSEVSTPVRNSGCKVTRRVSLSEEIEIVSSPLRRSTRKLSNLIVTDENNIALNNSNISSRLRRKAPISTHILEEEENEVINIEENEDDNIESKTVSRSASKSPSTSVISRVTRSQKLMENPSVERIRTRASSRNIKSSSNEIDEIKENANPNEMKDNENNLTENIDLTTDEDNTVTTEIIDGNVEESPKPSGSFIKEENNGENINSQSTKISNNTKIVDNGDNKGDSNASLKSNLVDDVLNQIDGEISEQNNFNNDSTIISDETSTESDFSIISSPEVNAFEGGEKEGDFSITINKEGNKGKRSNQMKNNSKKADDIIYISEEDEASQLEKAKNIRTDNCVKCEILSDEETDMKEVENYKKLNTYNKLNETFKESKKYAEKISFKDIPREITEINAKGMWKDKIMKEKKENNEDKGDKNINEDEMEKIIISSEEESDLPKKDNRKVYLEDANKTPIKTIEMSEKYNVESSCAIIKSTEYHSKSRKKNKIELENITKIKEDSASGRDKVLSNESIVDEECQNNEFDVIKNEKKKQSEKIAFLSETETLEKSEITSNKTIENTSETDKVDDGIISVAEANMVELPSCVSENIQKEIDKGVVMSKEEMKSIEKVKEASNFDKCDDNEKDKENVSFLESNNEEVEKKLIPMKNKECTANDINSEEKSAQNKYVGHDIEMIERTEEECALQSQINTETEEPNVIVTKVMIVTKDTEEEKEEMLVQEEIKKNSEDLTIIPGVKNKFNKLDNSNVKSVLADSNTAENISNTKSTEDELQTEEMSKNLNISSETITSNTMLEQSDSMDSNLSKQVENVSTKFTNGNLDYFEVKSNNSVVDAEKISVGNVCNKIKEIEKESLILASEVETLKLQTNLLEKRHASVECEASVGGDNVCKSNERNQSAEEHLITIEQSNEEVSKETMDLSNKSVDKAFIENPNVVISINALKKDKITSEDEEKRQKGNFIEEKECIVEECVDTSASQTLDDISNEQYQSFNDDSKKENKLEAEAEKNKIDTTYEECEEAKTIDDKEITSDSSIIQEEGNFSLNEDNKPEVSSHFLKGVEKCECEENKTSSPPTHENKSFHSPGSEQSNRSSVNKINTKKALSDTHPEENNTERIEFRETEYKTSDHIGAEENETSKLNIETSIQKENNRTTCKEDVMVESFETTNTLPVDNNEQEQKLESTIPCSMSEKSQSEKSKKSVTFDEFSFHKKLSPTKLPQTPLIDKIRTYFEKNMSSDLSTDSFEKNHVSKKKAKHEATTAVIKESTLSTLISIEEKMAFSYSDTPFKVTKVIEVSSNTPICAPIQNKNEVTIGKETIAENETNKVENLEAKKSKELKDYEFSKSWSQSITGTNDGKESGVAYIDGFCVKKVGDSTTEKEKLDEDAVKDRCLIETNKIDKKQINVSKDEEDEEEEEDKENRAKNEFIDDEAKEANTSDSMDSEEREYLKNNEIPVQGESIGSEDTEEDEEEYEMEEEENDSFIVSSCEEDENLLSTDLTEFSESSADIKQQKHVKRYKKVSKKQDLNSTDESDLDNKSVISKKKMNNGISVRRKAKIISSSDSEVLNEDNKKSIEERKGDKKENLTEKGTDISKEGANDITIILGEKGNILKDTKDSLQETEKIRKSKIPLPSSADGEKNEEIKMVNFGDGPNDTTSDNISKEVLLNVNNNDQELLTTKDIIPACKEKVDGDKGEIDEECKEDAKSKIATKKNKKTATAEFEQNFELPQKQSKSVELNRENLIDSMKSKEMDVKSKDSSTLKASVLPKVCAEKHLPVLDENNTLKDGCQLKGNERKQKISKDKKEDNMKILEKCGNKKRKLFSLEEELDKLFLLSSSKEKSNEVDYKDNNEKLNLNSNYSLPILNEISELNQESEDEGSNKGIDSEMREKVISKDGIQNSSDIDKGPKTWKRLRKQYHTVLTDTSSCHKETEVELQESCEEVTTSEESEENNISLQLSKETSISSNSNQTNDCDSVNNPIGKFEPSQEYKELSENKKEVDGWVVSPVKPLKKLENLYESFLSENDSDIEVKPIQHKKRKLSASVIEDNNLNKSEIQKYRSSRACDGTGNDVQISKNKYDKKQKNLRNVEPTSSIDYILKRCDEILEAASKAKKQVTLQNQKSKQMKKKSKEMKKLNNKETENETEFNPQLKNEAKQIMKAIQAGANLLQKQITKIMESSTSSTRNEEQESKFLPNEILEVISDSPHKKPIEKHSQNAKPKILKRRSSSIDYSSDNADQEKNFYCVENPSGLFIEENITPYKNKKLKIISKLELPTGIVYEEPITPKSEKSTHGFYESDATPKRIGFKVKQILSAGQKEPPKLKETQKIKKKLKLKEPSLVLPKPKWTKTNKSSSNKKNTKINSDYTAVKVDESIATEFMVAPLESKKSKYGKAKGVNLNISALQFKKNALYDKCIKRETSKQLLQRKQRQNVYNKF